MQVLLVWQGQLWLLLGLSLRHVVQLICEGSTIGGTSSHQGMLLQRESEGAGLHLGGLLAGLLLLLEAGPHCDGAGPQVIEGRPKGIPP